MKYWLTFWGGVFLPLTIIALWFHFENPWGVVLGIAVFIFAIITGALLDSLE